MIPKHSSFFFTTLLLQYNLVNSQFVGGYALRFSGDCPADGGLRYHRYKPGQSRMLSRRAESNCLERAQAANVCADDSWDLYIAGRETSFCSTSDLLGRQTTLNRGRGICVVPGSEFRVGDVELQIQSQGSRNIPGSGFSSSRPSESSFTSMDSTTAAPSAPTSSDEPSEPGFTSEDSMPPLATSTPTSKGRPSTTITEGPSGTSFQTRSATPTTSSGTLRLPTE
ncbi:hypothetical protein TWF281_006813 [Arthrobotrys megalospora]